MGGGAILERRGSAQPVVGISGFLLGSRYLRLQGLAFDCNAPKSLVSEVLRADAHAQLEIISPHRKDANPTPIATARATEVFNWASLLEW